MMQSQVREYTCQQFGHQCAKKFSVLETSFKGKGWRFAYLDEPQNHEWGVELIPDMIDGQAFTMWFTSPIDRKNFMESISTNHEIEQMNPGMVFSHLSRTSKAYGKFHKFVRNFFGIGR